MASDWTCGIKEIEQLKVTLRNLSAWRDGRTLNSNRQVWEKGEFGKKDTVTRSVVKTRIYPCLIILWDPKLKGERQSFYWLLATSTDLTL